MSLPIRFKDMAEREADERSRLSKRLFTLNQNHPLPNELEKERKEIDAKLKDPAVIDPLFTTVRDALSDSNGGVGDHVDGLLPSQFAQLIGAEAKSSLTSDEAELTPASGVGKGRGKPKLSLTSDEVELSVVYGILERDNLTNTATPRTQTNISLARGEYKTYQDLYLAVLPFIVFESAVVPFKWPEPAPNLNRQTCYMVRDVRADQWASVVRILVGQSVGADDDHLGLKTQIALGNVAGGGDNAPASSIDIDLPDLEQQSDLEILRDNVLALQGIYFASMMEELKVFQVLDKLVEMFQQGMLPLGKGKAGDILYGYWKKSVNRLSEVERRNLYSRAFGLPGGDAVQGSPNRDFNELWLRFIAAVSSFIRQIQVDDLLLRPDADGRDPGARPQGGPRPGREPLAPRVRDGVLRGDRAANPAQRDDHAALDRRDQELVRLARHVAGDRPGRHARARRRQEQHPLPDDGDLGRDHHAVAGRQGRAARQPVARGHPRHERDPQPAPGGNIKATSKASDQDLVNACNQYLSVTGTSEDRVEQYSQPIEGPAMTSRPIQIPSVARDLLESVGVRANGFTRN